MQINLYYFALGLFVLLIATEQSMIHAEQETPTVSSKNLQKRVKEAVLEMKEIIEPKLNKIKEVAQDKAEVAQPCVKRAKCAMKNLVIVSDQDFENCVSGGATEESQQKCIDKIVRNLDKSSDDITEDAIECINAIE